MQGIATAGHYNSAVGTADHCWRNSLRGDENTSDIDTEIRDHVLERQTGRHDAMIREGIVDQDLCIALQGPQFSKGLSKACLRCCVCRDAGTRDPFGAQSLA